MPLLETPGHSWASLSQSLMGSLLLYPGTWCTQGSVCALQESVYPVLCSGCDGLQRSTAEKGYPMSKVWGGSERSYPTSKEQRLHRRRRAERSYSMFKVRRVNFIQGKEQWLCFAGAAMKKYPTSNVRETQVRCRCCERASEGRHTKTIITEN